MFDAFHFASASTQTKEGQRAAKKFVDALNAEINPPDPDDTLRAIKSRILKK